MEVQADCLKAEQTTYVVTGWHFAVDDILWNAELNLCLLARNPEWNFLPETEWNGITQTN